MDENREVNQFFEEPVIPSAQPTEPPQPVPTVDPVAESFTGNEGYTVTPQGGYYSYPPQETPPVQAEPQYQPPVEQMPMPVKQPKPKKMKKEKRRGGGTVALAVVLALVIGLTAGFGGAWAFQRYGDKLGLATQNESNTQSAAQSGPSVQKTINVSVDSIPTAVAEKAMESVVGIRTTTYVESFFYGETEQKGEGSGVIYSEDGYIITNYHVIESVVSGGSDAKLDVYVGSTDSTPYSAKVIGYNISSDLAVIKIEAENLKAIELGSSDDLEIGDYVVTIGSPGGLDFMGSVTYGIISGLNRKVSTDSDVPLIQTDAAINPGNSGGALLNAEGKLIGINSSKIVSTEYEGMGFAIPISVVNEKYDNIVNKKNKEEAYIGVSVSMKYDSDTLRYYGYPSGAVVSGVDEDSPAAEAGLERGDIITEFNKKEISDPALLVEYVSELTPGQEVSLKIYRSGRYYSTTIKVGSNG